MSKFLKIAAISLTTIIVVVLIAVSIVVWVVFTPEKITPLIQQQAEKHLNCTSKIGRVVLTFFSTFPHFGLKIDSLFLVNPSEGAPSDTLVGIDQLVASVDFLAYWKKGKYVVNDLHLSNGTINIFTDSLGNTNYNIFSSGNDLSEPGDTVHSNESSPMDLNLEKVKLEHIQLSYIDQSNQMLVLASNVTTNINGRLSDNIFKGNIDFDNGELTFEYANEAYLQHFPAQFKLNAELDLSSYRFTFHSFDGHINDTKLNLKGFVEYQSQTGNTLMEIDYRLAPSVLSKVLNLVPPSFRHYYEDFEVEGILASEGKLEGTYSEKEMPFIEMKAILENGVLAYTDLPLKMHNVMAEIAFVSDLISDEKTHLTIERFDARTEQSTISTKGSVSQLFSNIYCDLNSKVSLSLDEFVPLLPPDMAIQLAGKATGNAKTAFTLTQIENLEFEKMAISGALTLSNFHLVYDTIYASTNNTNIEFALPNPVPLSQGTGFAYARVSIDSLIATTANSINAFIRNGLLIAEFSDVRDTLTVPHVICSFRVDSLAGNMDSISLAVSNPLGKLSISPRENNPKHPDINLVFSSKLMNAEMGNEQAVVNQMILNGNLIQQNNNNDVLLQWLVNGNIDIQEGKINLTNLSERIEIPAIKMAFDTENVKIEAGSVIIGRSDFSLTGTVNNLMSYYRGDSILKGDLSFVSTNADITQLMNMTSGIGYEQNENELETKEVAVSESVDSTYSGPYMVPKGIDMILNTNVKNATFGNDVASDIRGQVRVYDGTLVLDEMKLTTPAARMQLTAMYRTSRKNHLFLGIDYHMLDVEISELLRMIPDIDSIMPMLRSFGGEGEFHVAAETYLDSMYNPKMSTLRGAASIAGQDLVLMDGETFSEIAKTLRFSKHAENRVDSISAEFTIFREEVDVYPFLVVMDKYTAVVAGRHNLDMSFDYHISLVNSPVPIKLGVDVKGTLDDLKIRPAACKYAEFYRPVSRRTVESKQMELRRMIRESLTGRVSE